MSVHSRQDIATMSTYDRVQLFVYPHENFFHWFIPFQFLFFRPRALKIIATFLRRPVITLLHGDQRQAITFFFVIFRIRHIIGVFTPNTGAKTSCDILISRIRHGRLVVECNRVEATLGKQIPESQQWWCFRVWATYGADPLFTSLPSRPRFRILIPLDIYYLIIMSIEIWASVRYIATYLLIGFRHAHTTTSFIAFMGTFIMPPAAPQLSSSSLLLSIT